MPICSLSAVQAGFELRLHRPADARGDCEIALEIAWQSNGAANPTKRTIMFSLARVHHAMSDFVAAAALDREVIGSAEIAAQEKRPMPSLRVTNAAWRCANWATTRSPRPVARADRAVLREAFRRQQRLCRIQHRRTVDPCLSGRLDKALDLHERAQANDATRKRMPPGRRGAAPVAFGDSERSAKRLEDAATHVDAALEQLAQQDPPEDDVFAAALIVKGRILFEQQRADGAEPILRKALAKHTSGASIGVSRPCRRHSPCACAMSIAAPRQISCRRIRMRRCSRSAERHTGRHLKRSA